MRLKYKVALVTGFAGNGMGRSIALTLAREGAEIAINYRTSKDTAQAIVNHIKSRDGNAIAVEADVFEADDLRHPVEGQRNIVLKKRAFINSARRSPIGLSKASCSEFTGTITLSV